MPTITQRTNKKGEVSFLIRAYIGEKGNGKQIIKSKTWKPANQNMSPVKMQKEAEKEAALFEDKLKHGLIPLDGSIKFADFAANWLDMEEREPSSRKRAIEVLERVNEAIGHIPLDRLRAAHLEAFYKNLREPGIRKAQQKAQALPALLSTMQKKKLSRAALATAANVSPSTITAACRNEKITFSSAEKIAHALGADIKKLFTFTAPAKTTLSDRTIYYHHQVIHAILEKAVRQGLILYSPANQVTAPRYKKKEAIALTDETARQVLTYLEQEQDIRIKAAFILLNYTGMRRGELCGLTWDNIDMEKNLLHIEKQSQYLPGAGTTAKKLKTDTSKRTIPLPPHVTALLGEYRKWWLEQRLMQGDRWQKNSNYLFIKEDGRPLHPDTIGYWLKKFRERHNLPHFTPHSFRHTFCSLILVSGIDYKTVQSLSGHAQASTLLNTYAHTMQTAQINAINQLDNVLRKTN